MERRDLKPGAAACRLKPTISLLAFTFIALSPVARAGSATWKLDPVNTNWNTATNWMPASVPDGPNDVATFAASNQTAINVALVRNLGAIVFNSGASAFTIDVKPKFTSITIGGAGITNNSGITQNFITDIDPVRTQGLLVFANSATAGSQTTFTNHGGAVDGNGGAATLFTGTSSADHATFVNNGGQVSGATGGFVGFSDSATAANATFTCEGGLVSGALGGPVSFSGSATAADAVITLNGGVVSGATGAFTKFSNTASAGNATITANDGAVGSTGAYVAMLDDSTGGTARLVLTGSGNLDISYHNAPGVTCGSVESSGTVFLGALNLTVGSNNLTTVLSGAIQDGGQNGGTGGSLTKIGTGTLSLAKASTYTGTTMVNEGALLVRNTGGSATGSGTVVVNAGTLGGPGRIAGPVIIGTGSGTGAILAPGKGGPGTITLNKTLTFMADASYQFELRLDTSTADKVVARGVTIDTAALFNPVAIGAGTLAQGTVFVVISNAAAVPITGTFANLAEGSTITLGSNTLQVSYTGGDGNDLTLTVL